MAGRGEEGGGEERGGFGYGMRRVWIANRTFEREGLMGWGIVFDLHSL